MSLHSDSELSKAFDAVIHAQETRVLEAQAASNEALTKARTEANTLSHLKEVRANILEASNNVIAANYEAAAVLRQSYVDEDAATDAAKAIELGDN